MADAATSGLVEHLFRHEAGRLLAGLGRRLGVEHLDLAEEAVQDALVQALKQWPFAGVPPNPAAWLARTAHSRALDQLRRRATHQRALAALPPRAGGVAIAVPPPAELPARLDSVLQVVYLLFNEGYSAHAGDDLVRHDLCEEALRLGRLLTARPDTALPKAHALAALMFFHASRLPARVDGAGDLLRLADQDRSRWDRRFVHAGLRHLDAASEGEEMTAYHI